jgi:hypothetical protein
MAVYCERFLSTLPSFNQCALFFVYGHSFELTRDGHWPKIEELFKMVGGRDDVWYATNIEIYNYVTAYNSLVYSADGNTVYNPTLVTLYFDDSENSYVIKPGETIRI